MAILAEEKRVGSKKKSVITTLFVEYFLQEKKREKREGRERIPVGIGVRRGGLPGGGMGEGVR